MKLEENISLRPYNSFGIDASARLFGKFSSLDELAELMAGATQLSKEQALVLGGGSNLLFTKDFPGLVAKNELRGIERIKEDQDHYYIKAAAGENWHQFVLDCINKGYAGLENLSLIPGSVGASPIQNIGAYGVEIKDVFHSLEAWHIQERTLQTFQREDCGFGYRDSVFKQKFRNRFVILSVTFRLPKKPVYHTGYGAIEQELEKMQAATLTPKIISDAVIRIRSSKLPDPGITGNAGSFFKNPVITQTLFDQIKETNPTIPGYPANNGQIKTAAGWLIEQCGWKGYRKGDAGCYDKQALVLVNYGNATGKEIYALSEAIIESVATKFTIHLEREVNIF